MAELILELYSEEIPPKLQIEARDQLKLAIQKKFEEENLTFKEIFVYSSPTRLSVFVKDIPEKIKIKSKEIKGPKIGSSDEILQGFTMFDHVWAQLC